MNATHHTLVSLLGDVHQFGYAEFNGFWGCEITNYYYIQDLNNKIDPKLSFCDGFYTFSDKIHPLFDKMSGIATQIEPKQKAQTCIGLSSLYE